MFLHQLLKLSLVPVNSTGEESYAFICVWGTNVPIWAAQTSPSSCLRVLASVVRAKLPTKPWLCRLCEGRPLFLAQILLLSQAAWVHWIPTEVTCSNRSPQKCPIVYLVWLLKRGKFYWLSYSRVFRLNTCWATAEICYFPNLLPSSTNLLTCLLFAGRTFWPDGSLFIWEATPPQHLARLEYSEAVKSVMVTQFWYWSRATVTPILMQLHLDKVLRPVPDLHIPPLFQKTFPGMIPCSLFQHQPIMPDPVLTQVLQSSPVTLIGVFSSLHTQSTSATTNTAKIMTKIMSQRQIQ